jgi:hypothetical protein
MSHLAGDHRADSTTESIETTETRWRRVGTTNPTNRTNLEGRRSRMLVSDLQQSLHLLLPPLRAVEINAAAEKSVTKGLEAMADALSPFKDLSIDQLSDLLRLAQEYRETGHIPEWVPGKKPTAPRERRSTPKAPKAPKMTRWEALARLEALRSQSQDLDTERITNEVRDLMRLSEKDLNAVQMEFLGAMSGRNK